MGFKILLDANILISASICFVSKEIDFDIKHRFYDESKTLVNYFRKNIDKKEGIFTALIDKSSSSKLSKAVLSTIDEIKRKGRIRDEKTVLQSFSVIFSECLRKLEENKECLVRETVNEQDIQTLMSAILTFYNYELKQKIMKDNPQKKIEYMLLKANFKGKRGRLYREINIQNIKLDFPHFSVLKKKFLISSPDTNDMELLAQAIYFNKVYKKNKKKCLLCSKDHHFIAVNFDGQVQDLVPKSIKSKFGVECLSPKDTLKKLKQ